MQVRRPCGYVCNCPCLCRCGQARLQLTACRYLPGAVHDGMGSYAHIHRAPPPAASFAVTCFAGEAFPGLLSAAACVRSMSGAAFAALGVSLSPGVFWLFADFPGGRALVAVVSASGAGPGCACPGFSQIFRVAMLQWAVVFASGAGPGRADLGFSQIFRQMCSGVPSSPLPAQIPALRFSAPRRTSGRPCSGGPSLTLRVQVPARRVLAFRRLSGRPCPGVPMPTL